MTSPMNGSPFSSQARPVAPAGSPRHPPWVLPYFTQVKPQSSVREYPTDSFCGQVTAEFYGANRDYCGKCRGYLSFDTKQWGPTLD